MVGTYIRKLLNKNIKQKSFVCVILTCKDDYEVMGVLISLFVVIVLQFMPILNITLYTLTIYTIFICQFYLKAGGKKKKHVMQWGIRRFESWPLIKSPAMLSCYQRLYSV